MSDLGPFRKDFSPVVRAHENVCLVPFANGPKYFRVEAIEPIREVRKDFGSLATTVSSANTKMDTEMEMEKLELGQFRVIPLDDCDVAVFQLAGQRKFGTKFSTTKISQENPRHHAKKVVADSDTDNTVWTVTSGRRARLLAINAHVVGATASQLRFNDGAAASAANSKLTVQVAASTTVTLGPSSLPQVDFYTDIRCQASAGATQNVLVTVFFEEDVPDPFKDHQGSEVFVFEDDVPSFTVTNPTSVTQANNRVAIFGYKYALSALPRVPDRYTVIPVRAFAGPQTLSTLRS